MRRVIRRPRSLARGAQTTPDPGVGPLIAVRPAPHGTRSPESNSPLPATHERPVDGREVGVKRISKATRELQFESPARRLVVEKKTDGAIPHEADISPVEFEQRSDPHTRRREDSEEQGIPLTSPALIGSEVCKQGVQLRRGGRRPSSVSRLPHGQAIAASNLLSDLLDRAVHVLDRFRQTKSSEFGRECPGCGPQHRPAMRGCPSGDRRSALRAFACGTDVSQHGPVAEQLGHAQRMPRLRLSQPQALLHRPGVLLDRRRRESAGGPSPEELEQFVVSGRPSRRAASPATEGMRVAHPLQREMKLGADLSIWCAAPECRSSLSRPAGRRPLRLSRASAHRALSLAAGPGCPRFGATGHDPPPR